MLTNPIREGYILALKELMDDMIRDSRSPRKWLIHIKDKIDRMERELKSCIND